MKILIFIAVFVAVCGQTAVNVQADVIECIFFYIGFSFIIRRYDFTCIIKSIKQDENQNVITGYHETGKSDSDVLAFSYWYRDSLNLTNFDSIFCQKFPNLKTISLSYVKPVNLVENALHGCQNLNIFHLENVVIKQIPHNFFSNSSNLRVLSLVNIRLETLPENFFQPLSKLWQLDLSSNNLSTLNPAWFDDLKSLELLLLGSNKIEELQKNIFVKLDNLKVLWLNNNNLVTIHADSFGKKPLLERVYLPHNKITSIDEKFIDDTVVYWLYMNDNNCNQKNIGKRNEMKLYLQKCFKDYQPRQQQANTTTIKPTTTTLLTTLTTTSTALTTTSTAAPTTSTTTPPTSTAAPTTSTAASAKVCGVARIGQGNVIGGDFIQPHSYPWVVAVTNADGNYLCGGVVMSDRKVVTAAHCMWGKQVTNPRLFSDIMVLLGPHNLKQLYQIGRRAFAVQKIHIHPEWSTSTANFDADIAVLVLEHKIVFDDFIQPICLIKDQQSQIMSIDTGVVVGYGRSEDSDDENIPKAINMLITKNDNCIYLNNPVYSLSSERAFCAGNKYGTDICAGDSGSGLFVQYNDVYYLRGIVSSSPPEASFDCDVNKYSVFGNITDYHDWIDGINVN